MISKDVQRVLMTGDTVGGVWTFCIELATALTHHDIEVVLVTFGRWPSQDQQSEAERISNLHFFPSTFKLEWMDDPWSEVAVSGKWLLELEREYSPDIVHLNSFGHGSLPWKTPVVLTAHSCVSSWWRAVKQEPLPKKWNRYRQQVEEALKLSDAIVAPSFDMARSLTGNYDLEDRYLDVIYNGRDPSKFHSEQKESFILTAGRLWDEAKNVAVIASIAEDLPWAVYLAGEPRNPNGDEVFLPGWFTLGNLSADELATWYARAAIYTILPKYEPFGFSALEAALSGCALVLGDIPSLREIWEDGAIFVSPDDPQLLKKVLCDLIADPMRRTALAQRGQNRAFQFTAQRMSSEYIKLYRHVAERRAVCVS